MFLLRQEAIRFIYEHGWWVIYIEPKQKCHCVVDKQSSEGYNSPDPRCPYCFGTGYATIKKFIKVRDAYPNVEQRTVFWGDTIEDTRIFYTTYDVEPSVKGYIVDVSLAESSFRPVVERPIKVNEIYNIKAVRAMRGDGGLVAYYRLVCTAGI